MKKKKILAFICFFIVVSVVSALVGAKVMEDKYINDSSKTINKNKGTFTNRLSMMLENESGQYVATTAEAWPTTGYKFNSKLSKCENGGKVSWDFANKRVKMEGSTSDKCFIYFDKIVTVDSYCDSNDNLADCIKTYGNAGYDKSSIYIHNSNLANGAGDGSYRFAGPNEYVNNFVCFGSDAATCPTDNLYRIIGVFGDQVKLIKYDYATSALLGTDGDNNSYDNRYYWNYNNDTSLNSGYGSNVWSTSLLNTKNLNTNFINNIGSKWSLMIASTSWKVGGRRFVDIQNVIPKLAYQNEIVSPLTSTTFNAKIGLMYVSDYGFAATEKYWTTNLGSYDSAIMYNWMYKGVLEWTITPSIGAVNSNAFSINSVGYVFNNRAYNAFNVRPAFYLKSSIKYGSGKGTKESPIRLEITLTDVVKDQYTGTQGTNGIYLHNSSLANSANDGSYRYAGANPNNYVCFGATASTCPTDNLYRIIGVFGDQVKLIKADYATSTALGTSGAYTSNTYSASSYSNYKGSLTTINRYYWTSSSNSSNVWSGSALNTTNLNGTYLTHLGTTWTNKIATTTWKVGGNTWANIGTSAMYTAYQNEIVSPAESTTYSAKIGLMYVSDYGYAASPTYWTYPGYSSSGSSSDYRAAINANWMYMGLYEWTISRRSGYSNVTFRVNTSGYVGDDYVHGNNFAVRPVFYLTSSVNYAGGTGTSSDPYHIA